MLTWLAYDSPFPPVEQALEEPNGLLAAGGDLSPGRLVDAYSQGIFPWFGDDEPILWWSPDPRMVLFPSELKVSRSLRKTLKKGGYEVRLDTAFRQVMEACAEPRDDPGAGLGLAHSAETWVDGELAGGLYGVALGRMFYGESMFTRVSDASKIAFVHLVRQLERKGFGLIDCQMKTAHLASLGAREISRAEFLARLTDLVNYSSSPGAWTLDHDLLA